MMERERMTRRALLAIRRDDEDLAEGLRRFCQALDAVRQDTVVVRDQESHRRLSGSSSERWSVSSGGSASRLVIWCEQTHELLEIVLERIEGLHVERGASD